jgi:hypothetical protein
MAAVEALATGNMVKGHDPVADAEFLNISTDRRHNSGGLMAENTRGGMGPGCNLLQIRSTNAAGVDPYEQFAGSDFRNGNRLQTNIVEAAVNRCLHGGGERSL